MPLILKRPLLLLSCYFTFPKFVIKRNLLCSVKLHDGLDSIVVPFLS